MNKALSIVILIAGIVLLIYGFSAMNSISSSVSETVTGAPTNKSIVLLLSGAVLAVIGTVSVARRN